MIIELPIIEEERIKNLLEQHKNELISEVKTLISELNYNEILTRDKVLEMLDCSETWLSQMTTNGTIPSRRIGNRVFYSKNDILNINKKKRKNNSNT